MAMLDNVEDWDQYGPGGFHPIVLGDYLAGGRFSVCAKLGNGGFGTVWLCQDLSENTWKAVKVLAASDSNEDDCSDLAVLDLFMEFSPEERAKRHICLPEGYFFEEGPNGRHLCLVLPLLGQSLENFWHTHGDDPALLKHICGQLVVAMDFLHSKKVCHGDFRPANILFRLTDMDDLSYDEMMAMIPPSYYIAADLPEPTEADPVPKLPPHIPACLYTATNVNVVAGHTTVDIMVTDFGEAYIGDHGVDFNGIPLAYAAPEVVLGGGPLGYATDIWALGATICEIRQGQSPFWGMSKSTYVRRLEDLIGPLPEPYRSAACNDPEIDTSACIPGSDDCLVTLTDNELKEFRADRLGRCGYEDALREAAYESEEFAIPMEDGEDLTDKPHQRPAPGGYKYVKYQISPEEASLLHDLLRRIFGYHQAERLTLGDVMLHPWFADWFDQNVEQTQEEEKRHAKEEDVMPEETYEETSVSAACEDIRLSDSQEEESTGVQDLMSLIKPIDMKPAGGASEDQVKKTERDNIEEFDFDKEMRDPFGPIYLECKRLWHLEHPQQRGLEKRRVTAVSEPQHTQAGSGFFTSMFSCQVM